jgi:hypothetical protein
MTLPVAAGTGSGERQQSTSLVRDDAVVAPADRSNVNASGQRQPHGAHARILIAPGVKQSEIALLTGQVCPTYRRSAAGARGSEATDKPVCCNAKLAGGAHRCFF